MFLKDLVGKMAIRTMEPVNPFDPLCVINDGLRGKIWSPTFGGRGLREYMDEPSKIVNVEDDQVVVEYKGERKLLEPKYIDSNWIEYEKPCTRRKKNRKKMRKLQRKSRRRPNRLEDSWRNTMIRRSASR